MTVTAQAETAVLNTATPTTLVNREDIERTPRASRSNSLSNPTWIWIRRDLLDDALVPLNADLDQNDDPEVAQRGRNLDA